MAIFSFFGKRPKPRGFNHTPIYYDKRKEEMEKRILKAKDDLNLLTDEEKQNLNISKVKGSFRENIPGGSYVSKHAKSQRIRLVIIICLLVLALYFMFYY